MPQTRQAFLIVLLLLCTIQVHAQRRKLDSMLRIVNTLKEDTAIYNKADCWIQIAMRYENNQPDSAIYYLNRALALSKRIHYDMGIIQYLSETSAILTNQDKYDESNEVIRQEITLLKKLKDENGVASANCNLALNYTYKNDFQQAVLYYQKADSFYESKDKKRSLVYTYGNLSGVYEKLHQPQKGYEYGMKAIQYCHEVHNEDNISNALINTGNCLFALGRYDEATQLIGEAEQIADSMDQQQDRLVAILNLNRVYKQTGNYTVLRDKAILGARIATKLSSTSLYGYALLDLSYYYLSAKDYRQAKDTALRVLELSKKFGIEDLKEEACVQLGRIAAATGNWIDYERYLNLHDSLQQIVLSDKIVKNTQEFDAKYETAKKEETIKLQGSQIRQNRLLNGLLALSLITALLIIFLSLRNYRNKQKLLQREQQLQQQKILRLEQEQQLMATKAVLKGQDEERSRIAKDLHDGLGGLLSGIKFSFTNVKDNLIMTPDNHVAFERGMDMLDTSIKELRRVAHNMMPESLIKFGLDAALKDLSIYISQTGVIKVDYQSLGTKDVQLDNNITVNIYRIVQELLNNTLKHAAATEVLIQLIRQDQSYTLTVEDNGRGFDPSGLKNNQGMGMSSIENRVNYLKGKMNIQSSPDKGTSVFIEFNEGAMP